MKIIHSVLRIFHFLSNEDVAINIPLQDGVELHNVNKGTVVLELFLLTVVIHSTCLHRLKIR